MLAGACSAHRWSGNNYLSNPTPHETYVTLLQCQISSGPAVHFFSGLHYNRHSSAEPFPRHLGREPVCCVLAT